MSSAPEPIHTLADLEAWSFSGEALAVVGHPIAHSLSPAMHNDALEELAKTNSKFQQWHYFKFDIAPDQLGYALKLFHEKKFRGLNLTVPHKLLVMEYLDLKAQEQFLREMGAANTLKYTPEGWQGYNTDGLGLSTALDEDLNLSLKGAEIILLGAGGAARAAAVECMSKGCASLWIGNRTEAPRQALLATLKKSYSLLGDKPTRLMEFDPNGSLANLPANSIVINATSLGLKPDDPSPLDLAKIPRPAKVYDMIYRPPETALLRQAAQMNILRANGLSMLIHQGARSLELWTGELAPVSIMRAAALAAH